MLSVTLTSCATRTIIAENECPLFPELIELDQEMIEATPAHVQSVVIENYIKLVEWGEKLEIRANCVE